MPSNILSVAGIKAGFSWNFEQTTAFGSNTANAGSFSYSSSLANGTGAGKATVFYASEFDLAASANLAIDLAAGVTDVFGDSISFTKIRYIYIEVVADAANVKVGSSITVGGHAAAVASFFGSATDTIKVRNGGCFQLSCTDATGYAVTGTTADTIKILNNDAVNALTVRIGIVGE